MKRKFFTALLAVIMIISSMFLYGCGNNDLEITDADAEKRLKELVPMSYEINNIFFGEGLKADDEAYKEQHSGTFYCPVSEECGYDSIGQIKEAAEAVYAESYLKEVYVAAFEGMVTQSEDEGVDSSYSARYKEISGVLCVNISAQSLPIRDKMTVKSAKVIEKTPQYVKCEAKVEYSDGAEESVEFSLTCEGDVWLLYAPTY